VNFIISLSILLHFPNLKESSAAKLSETNQLKKYNFV